MTRTARTATAMLALVALMTGALAMAAPATAPAEPPKLGEGKGQVTLTWDEFVKITGYDPAKKGNQVLTIPWDEVEKLTGLKVDGAVKGATVDLPWKDFQGLLEWSIKRKDADENPPPADFVINSCQYVGDLTDEGATFKLTVKLNVLRKKGWKRIPLLPAAVAVTGSKLPQGVFLNTNGPAYELLIDNFGEMEIVVDFAVAVQKNAGINQVSFPRVLSGAGVVSLTIDRESVDVKITGAQSQATKSADKKTNVVAAVPSGTAVEISWERALPKVPAAPTKIYAETRTLVAVAEGMLLCQEAVNYNILHTAVRELTLQVPAGASVLTVFGPNLQDWRAEAGGKLSVILKNEVIGSYVLRVTYEQPSQDSAETPVIHATAVERERGYVGVVAVSNVEIAAGKIDGATAIDVRQLPGDIVSMTNQPILLAFRYLGEKFSIPLTIKKHEEVGVLVTIVDSAAFTAMQLPDGRRITKVIYSVRNNRNQFLRLKMPAGLDKVKPAEPEIWSVSVAGNTVSPAKDDTGNVLIPLVRSAAASQELAAFPVEIVYVETPKTEAPTAGDIHVDLPLCGVPVMQVMYSYYVPAEGKYTVGWGASGFSGPLALVDDFTSLAVAGRTIVHAEPAKEAQQMQQQFDVRVDAEAQAAGATPIRVRLPVNGKLFKLEKILVLPNDKLYFELKYSGWKAAK